MQRFFVEPDQVKDKEIWIIGADVNHIKNVLRMKPGEALRISNQSDREYICCIREISNEKIIAKIQSVQNTQIELPSDIYLFQGMPKSDKMELIIQKAVELGIHEIIPVVTQRTVVKLDRKKEEYKRKRWQSIAEGAAKQSGRMYIPEVTPVKTFKEALKYSKKITRKIIPYELADQMEDTKDFLRQIRPGESIGVFIGPEGGFSPEEISQAINYQIRPVTLGKRILRTETAGLAVLSVLMFALEG